MQRLRIVLSRNTKIEGLTILEKEKIVKVGIPINLPHVSKEQCFNVQKKKYSVFHNLRFTYEAFRLWTVPKQINIFSGFKCYQIIERLFLSADN